MKFKKNENKTELAPLGAIWSNEKDGSWWGSGSFSRDAFEGIDLEHFHDNLSEYVLRMFPTKEEWKKEGSPDFRIFISPREEKKVSTSKGAAFKKSLNPNPAFKPTALKSPKDTNSDADATRGAEKSGVPWED